MTDLLAMLLVPLIWIPVCALVAVAAVAPLVLAGAVVQVMERS